MIRTIVYPGAIPQDTDILSGNRNAMVADGWLAQLMFGTSPAVTGCVATATGTLLVNISGGAIAQLQEVDATAYGSLAINTNQIMKVAFGFTGVGIPLTAPTTAGYSVNWLIEAQIITSDATPVVLPYVNSANPSMPYSGPGNSGTPNNTQRADSINFQYTAGAAAPTGTQTTPATDSGWIPLYVITVNYGQTSIPSNQIAVHPQAPFVRTPLQQIQNGFSNQVQYTGGASGTFTVPPGIFLIRVTATGGGGNGGAGGGSTGATYIGGGGSGGGSGTAIFAVTPGQQANYSVGGAGASTTLVGFVTATGGSAGSAGSGSATGAGAASGGSFTATGALGSVDSHSGNGGQSGYAAGTAAVGGAGGGAEGRAVGTQNPVYSTSGSGAGLGGFGYGDGGSGGVGTSGGGAGQGGRLKIEY